MKVENINDPLIWLLLEPVVKIWQLEFFSSKIWPIGTFLFIYSTKIVSICQIVFFSASKKVKILHKNQHWIPLQPVIIF